MNQFTNHSNELFYKFHSTFCSFTVSKRDACHRHHDPERAEGQLWGHDHHQGPVRNSRHFLLHVRKIEVKLFSRAKNVFIIFEETNILLKTCYSMSKMAKKLLFYIFTLPSLKRTVSLKHFTRCHHQKNKMKLFYTSKFEPNCVKRKHHFKTFVAWKIDNFLYSLHLSIFT